MLVSLLIGAQQAAYLFSWLLLLRIEEVIHIEFESIDVIPGERV